MPRVESEAAIEDVADTALWIAAYRARETARADALFREPLAARLAGPKGARLAATMTGAEQFCWMTTIRTVVIDELLHEAVARGASMVLKRARATLLFGYWVRANYGFLVDAL